MLIILNLSSPSLITLTLASSSAAAYSDVKIHLYSLLTLSRALIRARREARREEETHRDFLVNKIRTSSLSRLSKG